MRQYFYKDKLGRMQKFVFCLRCNVESYRQEQIGKDIIKVSDTSYLCIKCGKELGILENLQLKQKEEENDTMFSTKIPSIDLNTEEEDSEENVVLSIDPEIEKEISSTSDSFFAYILKCNDGTFYAGITKNVENAVKNHNWGSGSIYTKKRKPVILVISKKTSSMEKAKKIKIELQKEYKTII
jgi:putative endonuclease